jgi:putative sigma-54 modulation protein
MNGVGRPAGLHRSWFLCRNGECSVQITIAARHGHLSDASQAKIKSKLEKLTRIFDRLTAIEVAVDLSKPAAPLVDLRVSAEHKHDFVAEVTGEELMGCVDGAVHKLEMQLRKYKERVQERHRGPVDHASGEVAGQ